MQCSLRLSQLIPGRASRRSHNRSSNPHPSGHSFSALAPGQEHSPTHVDSVHGRLQSRRSSPAVLQPVPVKHPGCLSIAAAVLLHTQVSSAQARITHYRTSLSMLVTCQPELSAQHMVVPVYLPVALVVERSVSR
eukprot:GHUV01010700.1.p1 GENE.GHUV01010700.1~~GHUV01010700.1.p1  ORF type:complete len:135 (+),score=15.03 GHUV01010700.1:222-626(+)